MILGLHGHPQIPEGANDAGYVDISCQSNWVHGENPRGAPVPSPVLDLPGGTFGNGKLGHTHNDLLKYPLYREVTGPFSCRFAIKLFQVTGRAGVNPDWQDGIRDIVWDATGTSTPPDMTGDPHDEVTFTGSLVVDPSIAKQHPTKHGWWTPSWNIRTAYDNGDIVEQELLGSVFVMLDPTIPESDGYPALSSRVSAHSSLHPEEAFGTTTVETLRGGARYIPVAPLKTPMAVTFATAGYGADKLPNAITEVRADADIHHFVPGRVLFNMEQQKNHQFDYLFDPTVLGPGTHSIIIGRRQVTLSNDELIVGQAVIKVTVPGVTPPPPPPPPPVPVPTFVWQAVAMVNLEKEVNATTGAATGRLRLRIGDQSLIVAP